MSDFLTAIDLLVKLKKVPQNFTFNVCSARCTSVADLASIFVEQWYELTGQRSELTFLKNKDKNDKKPNGKTDPITGKKVDPQSGRLQ